MTERGTMQNKTLVSLVLGTVLLAFVILGVYRSQTSREEQEPDPIVPKPIVIENVSSGTILLPETITQFAADGPDGLVTVDIDQGVGQLPAGKYQIGSWRAERKDEQNNTWTLTGQQYGPGDPFEVTEGSRVNLNVGEPIVAAVHGRRIGPKYHAFTQSLQGRLDESITLTRNGSRPGPPKLRIKNKDGTYDRTFAFQYG